jgi:cell division protein FtsL
MNGENTESAKEILKIILKKFGKKKKVFYLCYTEMIIYSPLKIQENYEN